MSKKNIVRWLPGILAAILLIPGMLSIVGVISIRSVLTDSMAPTINAGDIVVGAPWIKPDLGEVGIYHQRDISGIIKQDVVHRVLTRTAEKVYQFKGDNNKSIDALAVAEKDIVGKVIFQIPFVGNLLKLNSIAGIAILASGIAAITYGAKRLRKK